MILQHPETRETTRVKPGTASHSLLIRAGYRDISPPRTPKQIEAADKWRGYGMVGITRGGLKQLLEDKNLDWTDAERKILANALAVVSSMSDQLKLSKST